jgi:hypothetical protein
VPPVTTSICRICRCDLPLLRQEVQGSGAGSIAVRAEPAHHQGDEGLWAAGERVYWSDPARTQVAPVVFNHRIDITRTAQLGRVA